ncbi:MAG: 30S ribosomal protein S12 methylthiotransferase RimO, partial [Firmicutes bacterium]|nr:30S ribosomal protein S12 methylthiotransferase RimO [Bacillota bacterium]
MKLYIETLGCPKNFNDSEGIGGIWEKAGMYLTDDPIDADAILVNTCGFINDAKTESIEKIFDMARIKEEAAADPEVTDKMLIVSGCLSQRYGEDLYEEIPEVDIFLGVNDYERLPQMVKGLAKGTRAKAFSCEPEAFEEFSARKLAENPYSATLRIAEGCNNRCAYCVIPQIRGKLRS